MELKIHPVANLFPMMSGEPFTSLVDDIKKNGLQNPVVMQGDTLIDGRNRMAACTAAGVKPHFTEYEGKDVVTFIISSNLHRRHLTESQRAMVAARLANLDKGSNQHAQVCAPSQSKAAELLNVSRRSVAGVGRISKGKQDGYILCVVCWFGVVGKISGSSFSCLLPPWTHTYI